MRCRGVSVIFRTPLLLGLVDVHLVADGGIFSAERSDVNLECCMISKNAGPAVHGIHSEQMEPAEEVKEMQDENNVCMSDQEHSQFMKDRCAYCYETEVRHMPAATDYQPAFGQSNVTWPQ